MAQLHEIAQRDQKANALSWISMNMNMQNHRIKKYSLISTSIACLSHKQLEHIIANGNPAHEGIGGKSTIISINDTPVFVKKVPLTDLEQLPQHLMSTENLFNLPLCYQYGVGSAGFGAWRELATHIMTSNWVISGECSNFPILYHWRILPSGAGDINTNYWGDIEAYCQYWENSSAIRKRVETLNDSSMYIALFLEYVPQTLHEWLQCQISKGSDGAENALTFVNKHLSDTNEHMSSQGLIHFDAHFQNILTDGERLYLSDFGLALSSKFNLTELESEFLRLHQSYDKACAATNLIYCIITSLFGEEYFDVHLRECLNDAHKNIPPYISAVIKQYGPIALIMDDFFQKLQKENKLTPYPAEQLIKYW